MVMKSAENGARVHSAKMLDRASYGSVFSERPMRAHLIVSRVRFQYATEVYFAANDHVI
jgi:hypothetical protein